MLGYQINWNPNDQQNSLEQKYWTIGMLLVYMYMIQIAFTLRSAKRSFWVYSWKYHSEKTAWLQSFLFCAFGGGGTKQINKPQTKQNNNKQKKHKRKTEVSKWREKQRWLLCVPPVSEGYPQIKPFKGLRKVLPKEGLAFYKIQWVYHRLRPLWRLS